MLITFDRNSNILRVALKNSSTGAGLTGLAYNSSGLIISTIADAEGSATAYTVAGSNVEDITTIGTYSAPTSGKCRFKAVDATNHPGLYEIQLADARFSVSNATKLIVSVHGAASLLQADVVIDLTKVDLQDAVRGGMTALPNANADAAGGLIISDAGGLDADAQRADVAAILVDTGTTLDGRIPAALVGGRMDASVGAMAANTVTASALAADAVDEIWDEVMTGTTTGRQSMMLAHATLAGKASGLAGTAVAYRNIADTTDVIAATVDADGNRTAVTITYP